MKGIIRFFPLFALLLAYIPLIWLPVLEPHSVTLLDAFFFQYQPIGFLLLEKMILFKITSLKTFLLVCAIIGMPGFYLAYKRIAEKRLAAESLSFYFTSALFPLTLIATDPYLTGFFFLGYLFHASLLLLENLYAITYFLIAGFLTIAFSHPYYALLVLPYFLILPFLIRFRNWIGYYGSIILLIGVALYWIQDAPIDFLFSEKNLLPLIGAGIPWLPLCLISIPIAMTHMRQIAPVKLKIHFPVFTWGIFYSLGFWIIFLSPALLLVFLFCLSGMLAYYLYHLQLSSSGFKWLNGVALVQGILFSLAFLYVFAFLLRFLSIKDPLLWVILLAFFFLMWGFITFGSGYEQKLLYPAVLTMMGLTIFFHSAAYPTFMEFIPPTYAIRMEQIVPNFIDQFYLFQIEEDYASILKVHFRKPLPRVSSLEPILKAREKGDVWVLTNASGFLEFIDNHIPLNRVIEIEKRSYQLPKDLFLALFQPDSNSKDLYYFVRIQGSYADDRK